MNLSPHEDFYGSLKYLDSMGFHDLELNRKALYHTNGNVQKAVEYITNPSLLQGSISTNDTTNAKASFIFPKLDSQKAEQVLQVAQLGFDDEGKIRHALHLTSWNLEEAIDLLLTSPATLDSSFSSLDYTVPQVPLRTIDYTRVDHVDSNVFNQPFYSNAMRPTNTLSQTIGHSEDKYSVFNQPFQSSVFNNNSTHFDLRVQPTYKPQPMDNPFDDRANIKEFDPFADDNKI